MPESRVPRLCFSLFILGVIGCDNAEDGDLQPLPDATDSGSVNDDDGGDTPEDFAFTDKEVGIILNWLGPLPDTPPPERSNAYADDQNAVALGKKLFFDPRYSGNQEISCATCHAPDEGFGDSRANLSLGIKITDRASIALFNGAFGAASEDVGVWQQWDGSADSQWCQALGPPESDVVMGGTRTGVALMMYDHYLDEYETLFGPMPPMRDSEGAAIADPLFKPGDAEWDMIPQATQDQITEVYVNFGKAIAAYERLLVSRNSRFDEFWNNLAETGEQNDALTDLEKAGLRVFIGRGRCLGCHSGPNFTDNQFHNIAIPQFGENVPESDEGRALGLEELLESEFNCAGQWSDHPNKDECAVSKLDPSRAEVGAFKTPTLRSVNLSPPYMHTGTFQTLEDVILHYDLGGGPTGSFQGTRDELMRPLSLDALEREALVAFLRALEGEPLDSELTTVP